ncbi:CCHC-type zinc finger transcription factor [Phycomyces blakesleeanus NRRL 1555(-)]|uniref:CCHC-type zinc finger transcription factor n=1 Tax=Phycomyces blakesleeanus (strain ATCC 8743b / DSM 1359 / FGSC 10004 / NBRC 33097 / NRRL 1555) TaxID=763407 RepID=A0A167QQN0_PHYB8|nr:CCHC-type zinc finger transcription factor [Phycomyces blakesleeanus NRRL 1555(-)]OAD80080.1 CCHC-type zinc finger transcription factor [Phycomyces blakesleeanus NRRL 1555(-)]|eukprot:XP_018298120.1 CCHC-type zinc finger transcription factor [Phycomyces blakesleeanus NRRL 1555(-)]
MYSVAATLAPTALLPHQPRIIYGDSIDGLPRIWCAGTTPHTVFYNAPLPTSPLHNAFWHALKSFAFADSIIKVTLPSRSAPTALKVQFLDAASCAIACAHPISVSDQHFPACIAVAPGHKVYWVTLSQLPGVCYPDLVTGLQQCLAPFGIVREIVICESYTFFDGTGSVLLERPNPPAQQVAKLAYEISYNDNTTILREWAHMGSHCKYCKQMGHDIDACPARSSETRTCHSCNKPGHLQANCPHVSEPARRSATTNKRSRHLNRVPHQDRIVLPRPLTTNLPTGTSADSIHNPANKASSSLLPIEPQRKAKVVNHAEEETPSDNTAYIVDPENDTMLDALPEQVNSDKAQLQQEPEKAADEGLPKVGRPETRSLFIRHLRSKGIDLLALQETHAHSIALQDTFTMQFQSSSSLWSPHCGLVCLSKDIMLTDPLFSICGRCITATVSHAQSMFNSFRICVIYAPATYRKRHSFLTSLLHNPLLIPASPTNMILLGDLNHSLTTTTAHSTPPRPWLQFLTDRLVDCVTPTGKVPQPTFHRGTSSSTIDYIFASSDLASCATSHSVEYIHSQWSDHCLVTVVLSLPSSRTSGKGLWRANPRLAQLTSFQDELSVFLHTFVPTLPASNSPQTNWDLVKSEVTRFIKRFSRRISPSLSTLEAQLQRLRTAAIFTHLAVSPFGLWHVLRVVSLPMSFFQKIRSIMGSFLQRGTFPPISLDTFCLPRMQGGLGIIDPKTQQSALQLRWLQPIVHAPRSPPGLVPHWMSGLLQASLPSLSPLFPLLFPTMRPSGWQDLTFPLHLAFVAIDHLLHNFDNVMVNSTTCLALPLSVVTIVPASQARFPPSWQDLLVSHLYTFDPALASLRSISITSSHPRSRVINKFLGQVQLNTLTLHSIIVCACCSPHELTEQYPSLLVQDGTSIDLFPFFNALVPSQTWACLSTRTFRGLCSHHLVHARYFDPPCGSCHWRKFWSFPLPLVARNIWFRGLHDKISCRACLHFLLPLAFPSPTCSICSLSSDSQDHFFFTCPLKNAVWIDMWLEFFGTISIPTALHNAFHFFSFPSSLNSSIPPSTVFGCTLLAIWRHHWTFIFDDSPFVPSAVVGTACKTLTRICPELDLDPLF